MPISISRSLNSKARPLGSSTTERLHEYEMQPRGLTTTMVEADGTTRNVIGPTTLYERRRPSLTTDTSSFFEGGSGGLGSLNGSRRNSFCDSLDNAAAAAAAVHRRSMRSRSGTPVRSSGVCNSMMIIPTSASTGNVHSYLNQINNYNYNSSGYDSCGSNNNYGKLSHRMILSRPPPKPLPPKPTLYVSPPSPPPMTPRRSLAKLPPLPPRQIKHHYPIPPPSFPDAMVSVSKRLRNRSVSPTPANYAQLQLGSRPGLINAALGISDSPTKESIRRSLGGGGAGLYGPRITDYHLPSSQFSTGFHARNL